MVAIPGPVDSDYGVGHGELGGADLDVVGGRDGRRAAVAGGLRGGGLNVLDLGGVVLGGYPGCLKRSVSFFGGCDRPVCHGGNGGHH